MAWKETRVMDERMGFIVDWQRGEETVSELCRRYGVSRKTGYKMIERYAAEGVTGLADRSRAPHRHPNEVTAEVEAAIVALRRRYRTWGPKKILPKLEGMHPAVRWPAESTIGEVLKRHGLSVARARRHKMAPATIPLSACAASNDVWGIDFKGWFLTGDGERCEPLSLSDLAARYVLRLQAVERRDCETVWPILDAAFREFGAPRTMRSDNGPPFASTAAGGLSPLSVRLIKAGVVPERIDPGKPQQNGRHERLHLTLKQDTASPPAASLRAQQRRFDAFRRIFNEERPHEALDQTTPASHYRPSRGSYTGRLREPEYPGDRLVRRVRHHGEIKWCGELVYISEALVGEPIGLEQIGDDRWLLRYGPIPLGHLDAAGKFERLKAGACPRLEAQPQPPGGESVTHVPG